MDTACQNPKADMQSVSKMKMRSRISLSPESSLNSQVSRPPCLSQWQDTTGWCIEDRRINVAVVTVVALVSDEGSINININVNTNSH